jgi:hypothetical protein
MKESDVKKWVEALRSGAASRDAARRPGFACFDKQIDALE